MRFTFIREKFVIHQIYGIVSQAKRMMNFMYTWWVFKEEILPQSQTSVMNDCSTCREIKCRARSLKCENEFPYLSLINSVLYILDTEG